MCASFFSKILTVSITGNACLAQDGQEIIFTPLERIPKDLRISNLLLLRQLDLMIRKL